MASKAITKAAAIGIVAVAVVVVGVMLTFSSLSGAAQTAKPTIKSAEKTFALTQQEWGFNQTKSGPSIVVSKGDKVVLQVKNIGQFPHDLAVVDDAGNTLWNAKSRQNQEPGQSIRLEFIAREAGNYRLICTIPGHSQLGMEAKFIVQPS